MIYGAANMTIPNDERVIVSEKEYLKQLIILIDQTPLRVLGKWLMPVQSIKWLYTFNMIYLFDGHV